MVVTPDMIMIIRNVLQVQPNCQTAKQPNSKTARPNQFKSSPSPSSVQVQSKSKLNLSSAMLNFGLLSLSLSQFCSALDPALLIALNSDVNWLVVLSVVHHISPQLNSSSKQTSIALPSLCYLYLAKFELS